MLGYGWPDSDTHPDGPLPLSCHLAGRGARLVGDPSWWLTHWTIRMQPSTTGERDDDVGRSEAE